jgi:hypothetical protein
LEVEARGNRLEAVRKGIAAKDPDRQSAEIQIRVALMSRFPALGRAEIIRVALCQQVKG